jgi:hypothetical protein
MKTITSVKQKFLSLNSILFYKGKIKNFGRSLIQTLVFYVQFENDWSKSDLSIIQTLWDPTVETYKVTVNTNIILTKGGWSMRAI